MEYCSPSYMKARTIKVSNSLGKHLKLDMVRAFIAMLAIVSLLFIPSTLNNYGVMASSSGPTDYYDEQKTSGSGQYLLPNLRPNRESTINDYDLVKDPNTGHILLRFGASLANYGEGALEIVGIRDSTSTDSEPIPAYQRLYKKDGSYEQVKVGEMIYHDEHHHYHFVDAIRYQLINPDTGQTLTSDKASFCLADVDVADDSITNYSQTPVYNRCYHNENAKFVKMGVSPGWEDIYGKDLVGQAFDVTDLMKKPAKYYKLELIANPDGKLIDSNNGEPQKTSIDVLIGEGTKVGVGKSRPGV